MVDENNLELRLCTSLPLHDSLKTQIIIEFKAKKRVTISDYSFVARSENLSNQLVKGLKQFEFINNDCKS